MQQDKQPAPGLVHVVHVIDADEEADLGWFPADQLEALQKATLYRPIMTGGKTYYYSGSWWSKGTLCFEFKRLNAPRPE